MGKSVDKYLMREFFSKYKNFFLFSPIVIGFAIHQFVNSPICQIGNFGLCIHYTIVALATPIAISKAEGLVQSDGIWKMEMPWVESLLNKIYFKLIATGLIGSAFFLIGLEFKSLVTLYVATALINIAVASCMGFGMFVLFSAHFFAVEFLKKPVEVPVK